MKYKYTRQEVSQWLAENKLLNVEEINKVLLSGKGSGKLPNTKNKADSNLKRGKGVVSPTTNSRPSLIEEIEGYVCNLDMFDRPIYTMTPTDAKINELIKAVNYLLKQK